MVSKITESEIETLIETTDVECKAAQGRNGQGEVPSSVWETYSAMANTVGGTIYLGIEETPEGEFIYKGIKNIQKVRKEFWDTLNSKKKINRNILQDSDVAIINVQDKEILNISIPRAKRQDRPIYLKENPFGNTYLRRHEGDYRADDETVRRLIAEAVEDSRDAATLEGFSINDLDHDSIKAYQNRFSVLNPDSPWINLEVQDFLINLGVLKKNRLTSTIEMTKAGILLLGKWSSITEVFPYYFLDYQEKSQEQPDVRWVDRLTPDGTWSGNLFDFFQRVSRKLTMDLKVPFRLEGAVRIDSTPVHEALREALTNTLIHADFSGRISVLIEKHSDRFVFRNPGLMRVPANQAIEGGTSDCRNRTLQKLFRMVGFGDQAGSGIPKIWKNWREQHWQLPFLSVNQEFEFTQLELKMISLIPTEIHELLTETFGDLFSALPEPDRVILAIAAMEKSITHNRIKSFSSEHRTDITNRLSLLVQKGFLIKEGKTRARVYHLASTQEKLNNSPDYSSNSPDYSSNSPDYSSDSPVLKKLLASILYEWGYKKMPGRLNKDKFKQLLIELCKNKWISISSLSALLERDSKTLQDQYLTEMVAKNEIQLKYPDTRNHPQQAYGVFNYEQ